MKNFILLLLITLCFATGCSRSSGEKQPNILIAMAGDISFPHMGAYGAGWIKTPGFDRIAEEGILFMNAYTPNSGSSPSMACFLTGRNSWQLGEAANSEPYFPPEYTGFIESLERNGYYTGYTEKGWAPGTATDSNGVERRLTGKAFNSRTTTPPTEEMSVNDYSENFRDFLNSAEEGKPFCFWYASDEPHRDFEYGSGIHKGGKSLKDIDRVFRFWPDNEVVRTDLLDYAFEIEYFDSHLVKMLGILEERGLLENTIVIVTAVNGMPFPRVKGQAYDYSNHIPLAIMWGKGLRNKGREVSDFISSIDFAPTLLEAAGITSEESGMQQIQGKSFMNILTSGKKGWVDEDRRFVLIGKERHNVGRPEDAGYPIRGIIMDGFLYLTNYRPERWPSGNPETGYLDAGGSPTKSIILNLYRSGTNSDFWIMNFGRRPDEELYRLSDDPDCVINLASNAGYNPMKRKLHEEMYLELLQQDDPRMHGKGDSFDNYPYARESLRNFFSRFRKGEIGKKDADWADSSDFEGF